MAKNDDYSRIKDLLEAHYGALKDDIREIKSDNKTSRDVADKAFRHADEAHKKLDGWTNRAIGWVGGMSLGGGVGGAAFFKWFLGH